MINLGLAFIKRLIETVESSDIDTLEISRWGTRIRISKSPVVVAGDSASAAPIHFQAGADGGEAAGRAVADGGNANTPSIDAGAEAGSPAETANLVEIVSPMVGTFYRAPAPDAPPYVEVEDHVSEGSTLCILEAMKLMNELEAEVEGTVKEVCVENAEPVEYGQVLFRVLPD